MNASSARVRKLAVPVIGIMDITLAQKGKEMEKNPIKLSLPKLLGLLLFGWIVKKAKRKILITEQMFDEAVGDTTLCYPSEIKALERLKSRLFKTRDAR